MNVIQDYMDLCKKDYPFYCANEIWFPPRTEQGAAQVHGSLIRYDKPKPGQLKIRATAMQALKEHGVVLIDVFKARQVGSSTEFLALDCWRGHTIPFHKAGIASHNDESTAELFAKLKVMDQHHNRNRAGNALVPWPKTIRNNDNKIAWDNGSSVSVATVGETGRTRYPFSGFTPWFLHASECGKWTNPIPVWTSMINSVNTNDGSGAIVVRESTSTDIEGVGRWWYNIYRDHKAGATPFAMVFIGWFDDDENVAFVSAQTENYFEQWKMAYLAGDPYAERHAGYVRTEMVFDDYEKSVALENNLSAQQMKWFSDLLRTKYTGSLEERRIQRAMENPSNADEAFAFSGEGTFDGVKLTVLLGKAPKPVFVDIDLRQVAEAATAKRPVLVTADGREEPFGRPAMQQLATLESEDFPLYRGGDGALWQCHVEEAATGFFRMYEKPDPCFADDYFCGADVSEGTTSDEGDASAFTVMRLERETGRMHQCCTLERFKTPPEDVTDMAYPMLKLYFEPLLNVELPGPGAVVMRRLQEMYGYRHLYRRPRSERVTGGMVSEFGWQQSPNWRKLLIARTQERVRSDKFVLRDERTIEQFGAMKRRYKNGQRFDEHRKGDHDDLVFAVMLAAICVEDVEAEYAKMRMDMGALQRVKAGGLTFKEQVILQNRMKELSGPSYVYNPRRYP